MGWAAKLGQPSFALVKWGTGFVDFDNDGWLDVFVANGHVYPQVDAIVGGVKYREPMQLFLNKHDGTFEDISDASGVGKIFPASRRGAAFGDINNDGNIDILVLNIGEPPTLLLNTTQNGSHRVLFKLVGVKSNRAAIGARVTITSPSFTQFNEVRSGGSYISQNDLRVHFGLGSDTSMSKVVVSWPSGQVDAINDLPADFLYTITEGKGVTDRIALPAPNATASAPASAATAKK
jgi:hypothetical protein